MIDIDDILARGGARRLDLLRYCVLSITMEPLFLFLAGEYRLKPTHSGALALFDVFCAMDAPARLSAYEILPPRELGLGAEIAKIRERWKAIQAPPSPDDDDARNAAPWPGRALFDTLVAGVRRDTHKKLEHVSASYDPALTPHENLPGGRLTATQRHFLDRVWLPIVRPRLTGAGFWQIATVG